MIEEPDTVRTELVDEIMDALAEGEAAAKAELARGPGIIRVRYPDREYVVRVDREHQTGAGVPLESTEDGDDDGDVEREPIGRAPGCDSRATSGRRTRDPVAEPA